MRIPCFMIDADTTIGHGSMLYDVVAVKDYDTEIAIWYSSPTGIKRRTFHPEDTVFKYENMEAVKHARTNLGNDSKYTNVSEEN